MFTDESEGKISFSLRSDERDLILDHATTINSTLMQRLRLGVLTGKTLVYAFSVPDLEGLLDGLASEARHASNRKLRRRFKRLYEHLVIVLDRYPTQGSDRVFDEPPAMFADFKSEVRTVIEGQPFSDIDDLNIKIQEIAYERNRSPQKEFNGLSPLQVGGLIYTDWLTPNSGIQLNPDIPLLDLNGAELLSNARIFLQAITESGKTKATSAGNLNRKFVAEMVEQMNWPPGFLDDLKRYHKVWNEEDVFPLHVLRIALGESGLIRKFKGSFLITKIVCSKVKHTFGPLLVIFGVC